ncbi:methyltransferase domain-containing protein [Actinacidiphila sp. bgisy160]|uniref:methyltransferase domain-containing protein n=1 Tax=Actinacidiphila sp. bgisy160 TaxID=3413796 RepID=UPI003D7055B8
MTNDDRYAAAAVPLRARLVRRIVAAGELADPRWRAAFEEVPRHLFVPVYHRPRSDGGFTRLSADDPDPRGRSRWLSGAYADVPLITLVRDGEPVSSSSQPSLMAAMLEALRVEDGQRVLEIGAGTGYNAALLAHRLGTGAVTTVDLDAEITEAARTHLAAAGRPVTVVTGDGALGCPERAPYDRIVATCELPSVPEAWPRQCRRGGLILAPFAGGLIALRVTGPERAEGRFLHTPAYFVSLRGAGAVPRREAAGPAGADGSPGRSRAGATPPRILENELFRFLLGLYAGDAEVHWTPGGPTVTAADGSTAHAARDGTVRLSGPRDLWAAVEEAYALWRGQGQPPRDRFGMSLEDGRQWTWLDRPDGPHRWELRPAPGTAGVSRGRP